MRTFRNILIGLIVVVFSVSAADQVLQNPILQNEIAMFREQFNLSIPILSHNTSVIGEEVQGNEKDAVTKVSPAVVSIFGTKNTPQGFGLIQEISAGTGFFVDSDGYIVTNKHVVSDESSSYKVTLSNGKDKPATVVYRDLNNDLALIKISGSGYPVLNLADSSKLQIGQTVLGIGNAYGKSKKVVSSGAVASLNKTIVTVGDGESDMNVQKLRHVIQTTAQLYPGDSGGPLFDLAGNVVGVNVAMAEDQSNQSFSIPINEVKKIISQQIPNS